MQEALDANGADAMATALSAAVLVLDAEPLLSWLLAGHPKHGNRPFARRRVERRGSTQVNRPRRNPRGVAGFFAWGREGWVQRPGQVRLRPPTAIAEPTNGTALV